MSGYELAWLIVISGAVLGVFFTGMLLRRSVRAVILAPLLILMITLLLVPAPVPGYEEQWAPAFLVAVFEGLFQTAGQPTVALRLLVTGLIAAVAVSIAVIGLLWVRTRHQRRVPSADSSDASDRSEPSAEQ